MKNPHYPVMFRHSYKEKVNGTQIINLKLQTYSHRSRIERLESSVRIISSSRKRVTDLVCVSEQKSA